MYTKKIQQAIAFAAKAHAGQLRKVGEVPYIIHPMGVAMILSMHNAEENVIIAGLLHDTIEDTVVIVTDIDQEFGKVIGDIVNEVTEFDRTKSWRARKEDVQAHLPYMSHEALLVKAADSINNLRDFMNNMRIYGDDMWKMFKGTKEGTLEKNQKLLSEMKRLWPQNPLLREFDGVVVEFSEPH